MSDRIVSVDAEPILSTTSLVEEILPQSTCPKSPFDGPMVLPPHQSSFMAGSFDESLIPRSAEALVSRIQQEVLAELSEAQQSQVPMQSQAFHSNPQSAPVYVNSEATSIGPHSSAAQSILPVDAVPSQIPQEMPQAFTQTQAKIQQTRSEPQTVSMALVLVNRPPGYSTDVNHNGTSIPAQHTPIQQPYSVTVNPESQRGPGGDVSQAITETRIPQPVSHTYHQMPNPVSSTASHPANAPESSYTTPSETIYHPGPTYYVAAPVAGQPVAYAMPNAHSTAKYAITQSPTQANPHFGLIQYHSEPPQQTLYQPHMVTQPSSAAVGGSVFQPGQANMYQIPAFINPNLCGISFVPDKHGAAGHINQGNAAEYGAVQSNVGDPHYQHGPQNSATSNTPAGLIFQQSPMQQPHLGQQMSVMAIPTAGLVNSTQNVAPQASIQPYSSATTEAGTSVKPFQISTFGDASTTAGLQTHKVVNAAVENHSNREQHQEYQKASPPRESKEYILTPTPIRTQRAGQASNSTPQQGGVSTAWDFANSSPLAQGNVQATPIYTNGNQSHSPSAHSFPSNVRAPIPQLYQHQPRSVATQQHQPAPQTDISSVIQENVSSPQEKGPSNQSYKVAAEKLYGDATDSVQDRLTAFASSPMRKFPSASTVSSRHIEKDRLTCIHSLGILDGVNHARLNRITNLTNRLLSGNVCVISIVDLDRVIWISTHWSTSSKGSIKDEPRYESFCSWVVQDENGRGITVMDAKADPRCTHLRIKSGMEFYAGAPLVTANGIKIGALSVRGPTRSQFSIMDMNILHEMASWAVGEIEMLAQRRELEFREIMQKSRAKIGRLVESDTEIEKGNGLAIVESMLNHIREGLRASTVVLLRTVPDRDQFRSMAHSISTSVASTCSLAPGNEVFFEIVQQTLRKDPLSCAVATDPLPPKAQNEVDQVLNKNTLRCVSEIIWLSGQPSGILVAFMEGSYRTITPQDAFFTSSSASALSSVWRRIEILEAFKQSQVLAKSALFALRKHPVQIKNTTGLQPCLLIVEPVFFSSTGDVSSPEMKKKILKRDAGARGEAHAKMLAGRNAIDDITGLELGKDSMLTRFETENYEEPAALSPSETVGIVSDFNQMLDVLADRYGVKRARKFGNLFCEIYVLTASMGPDSGTAENLATFAHQLFFALDVYRERTRRHFGARVGIHCEVLPSDLAEESEVVGIWSSMVNTTYKLESLADTILVSDSFYGLTRDKCTYEAGTSLFVHGQGSVMTYRLIGTSTVPDEPAVMDKTGSGGSGGSGGASGGVTSASLSGIAPIATASTTVGASSGATSPQIGALLSSGVSFTTAATPGENISANLASPLSGLGAGLETGDVEVKARRRKACLIL